MRCARTAKTGRTRGVRVRVSRSPGPGWAPNGCCAMPTVPAHASSTRAEVLDPPGRVLCTSPAPMPQRQDRRVVAADSKAAQPSSSNGALLPRHDQPHPPPPNPPPPTPPPPTHQGSRRIPHSESLSAHHWHVGRTKLQLQLFRDRQDRASRARAAGHHRCRSAVGERRRRHPQTRPAGREHRPDDRVAGPAGCSFRVQRRKKTVLGTLTKSRQHVGDNPGGRLRPQPGRTPTRPDQS